MTERWGAQGPGWPAGDLPARGERNQDGPGGPRRPKAAPGTEQSTSRLFRTHFMIAAVSIFGCVIVGAWVLSIVVQSIETLSEREHQRSRQPPLIYANFIEQLDPKNAVEGLARMIRL